MSLIDRASATTTPMCSSGSATTICGRAAPTGWISAAAVDSRCSTPARTARERVIAAETASERATAAVIARLQAIVAEVIVRALGIVPEAIGRPGAIAAAPTAAVPSRHEPQTAAAVAEQQTEAPGQA